MTGSTKLGPRELAKFAAYQGLVAFIGNGELMGRFIAYAHRAGMQEHPYQWRAIARDWDRILRADPEAEPWVVG